MRMHYVNRGGNSVTITRGTETILRDSNLDNEFIPNVPKIDTE